MTQTAWVSHCPDWNHRGRWAKASMAKSRNPLAGVKGSNTLIGSAPWIPWKSHYLRFSFVAFFPLIVQFSLIYNSTVSKQKRTIQQDLPAKLGVHLCTSRFMQGPYEGILHESIKHLMQKGKDHPPVIKRYKGHHCIYYYLILSSLK